jgi:hypothetical protein
MAAGYGGANGGACGVAHGGTGQSGDTGDERREVGSRRLRGRAWSIHGGVSMVAGGLASSMAARDCGVRHWCGKATTAAIAYKLHPLYLEVSCSILDDPVWHSGLSCGPNFNPVRQICHCGLQYGAADSLKALSEKERGNRTRVQESG